MTASFVGSAPDASISAVSTATLTAVRLPRGPSGEEGCSSMLAELRRLQVVSERRWLWSRARRPTPPAVSAVLAAWSIAFGTSRQSRGQSGAQESAALGQPCPATPKQPRADG